MPYKEIELSCNIFFCTYNENGKKICTCNCLSNCLKTNNLSCPEFIIDIKYKIIADIDEIYLFYKRLKELDIPHLTIDPKSTHFQNVSISTKDTCIVRGEEHDIKKFNFWKNIEGGYGYTDKNQLDLFLDKTENQNNRT